MPHDYYEGAKVVNRLPHGHARAWAKKTLLAILQTFSRRIRVKSPCSESHANSGLRGEPFLPIRRIRSRLRALSDLAPDHPVRSRRRMLPRSSRPAYRRSYRVWSRLPERRIVGKRHLPRPRRRYSAGASSRSLRGWRSSRLLVLGSPGRTSLTCHRSTKADHCIIRRGMSLRSMPT